MTDHPITPPPELMHQWHKEACKDPYHGGTFFESKTLKHISTQAARWGADQELKACCEWFQEFYKTESWVKHDLKHFRAARRPKPPSDKELALEALQSMRIDPELIKIINGNTDLKAKYDTIRRALEQLDD